MLGNDSYTYCAADNPTPSLGGLISIGTLRKAILWGMKENLMISFVLPQTPLPQEYIEQINFIDHSLIGQDIKIANEVYNLSKGKVVILRVTIQEFISKIEYICSSLIDIERLNICFTDTEAFTDKDIPPYSIALKHLVEYIFELIKCGKNCEVNLITDRVGKTSMSNCGAGINNITIAPNGKFYLCPAFYYNEIGKVDNQLNHKTLDYNWSVGDLESGLKIPNQKLLDIEHAPICRKCDAFHCHRCIWLNLKLTGDINTPSHQQCIMAHLERNASRELEILLHKHYNQDITISEINYLDPIDLILQR